MEADARGIRGIETSTRRMGRPCGPLLVNRGLLQVRLVRLFVGGQRRNALVVLGELPSLFANAQAIDPVDGVLSAPEHTLP
jgi:hypothetical protein